MNEHEMAVATQVGPGGRTLSFAWCKCGWRGPLRQDRMRAAEDALLHLPEFQDAA